MKIPSWLARFVNWVEGTEVLPVPESKPESRPVKARVRRPRRKTSSYFRPGKTLPALYDTISVLVCLTMIITLLVTVSWLPQFGSDTNPHANEVYARYIENSLEEAGAVNSVAGMILDYRAFDTLGESNVLFIAVISVVVLLRADRKEEDGSLNIPDLHIPSSAPADDPVFRASAYILVPIGILFGIYVILNGHLSAGGGFSGGAVIGACLILYVNAFGWERLDRYFNYRTYKWVTFSSLITYTLLKAWSFYTGANGIESSIPLGNPGDILSSGLILPLNICVGLVVAGTMYAFYSLFRKGGIGDGK